MLNKNYRSLKFFFSILQLHLNLHLNHLLLSKNCNKNFETTKKQKNKKTLTVKAAPCASTTKQKYRWKNKA